MDNSGVTIMSTISADARLSREDLLSAVAQLDPPDFNAFVSQVLSLRAQRNAPMALASEAELLLRINQGLPDPIRHHYEELILKRQTERLDRQESEEILQLSEQVERLEANRVEALADLARLRGVTLTRLMSDLGIPATIPMNPVS
jgi:hypothetical protein